MRRSRIFVSLAALLLSAAFLVVAPASASGAPLPPSPYNVTRALGPVTAGSVAATANDAWALRVVLSQPSGYQFCPAPQVLSKAGPFYASGAGMTGTQVYVFQCVAPGEPGVSPSS